MTDGGTGTGPVPRSDGERSLFQDRQDAFDKSDCGNGPDEYGHYPCDPKVLFGGGFAECQVCGRVAPWNEEEN